MLSEGPRHRISITHVHTNSDKNIYEYKAIKKDQHSLTKCLTKHTLSNKWTLPTCVQVCICLKLPIHVYFPKK